MGQKRPHTDAGAAVDQLSAAFINLMAGDQDSRRLVLTENGALTHASSGSAAVDFFFNVADTTSGQGARQFLEQVGIRGCWAVLSNFVAALVLQLTQTQAQLHSSRLGDNEPLLACTPAGNT